VIPIATSPVSTSPSYPVRRSGACASHRYAGDANVYEHAIQSEEAPKADLLPGGQLEKTCAGKPFIREGSQVQSLSRPPCKPLFFLSSTQVALSSTFQHFAERPTKSSRPHHPKNKYLNCNLFWAAALTFCQGEGIEVLHLTSESRMIDANHRN
jgi:hypothetical protein